MDSGSSNLENVIDRILLSAEFLKNKLESVKEHGQKNGIDYQQQYNQLKDAHKIKELERQNTELRQALEDHQYGLEFIMSKYRSQVVELMNLNKMEKNTTPPGTICLKRNNSLD